MQSDPEIRRGWHKVAQICVVIVVYCTLGAGLNLLMANDASADDAARGAGVAGAMRLLGFLGAAVEGWFSKATRVFAE